MRGLDLMKRFQSCCVALVIAVISTSAGAAQTALADKPIGSTVVVPANVILDLSVEFPTADSDAYYSLTTYVPATTYSGYFNPAFCYDYKQNLLYTGTIAPLSGFFVPFGSASSHTCSGHWSGNFLNWVITQTIDPFRQALTGGARIVDLPSVTILQKAYSDSQAGTSNQQTKSISGTSLIQGATPFSWSTLYVSNYHTGLNFLFNSSNNFGGTPINFGTLSVAATAAPANTLYQAQGAVQVCASIDSADTRCRQYSGGYKPIGLMQKYAAENVNQVDSIRYSAFGYLLDTSYTSEDEQIDGGIMRSKMKSVGPFQANPGTTPSSNANAEWDGGTGVFVSNPNPSDASSTPKDSSDPATGVSNSGVISYLNNFGFSAASKNGNVAAYKVYDSVSELYYMATRYYRNLNNVASHTTNPATADGTATNDNFPVITSWDDPIKYSCSNNYIIGIGDIHTWDDANVPGNTVRGSQEPTKPAEVTGDTAVDARVATDYIANLEKLAGYTGKGDGTQNNSSDYIPVNTLGDALIGSIGSPSGGWGASQNSFYMAGLAYDAHTRDIRPDIANKTKPVTVSTFWLDVMESNDYHEKNQFWMAAKYGGFDTSPVTFPNGYTEYAATPAALPQASWNSSGYRDDHNNLAPDQYYQASSPTQMSNGLNAAFAKIQANIPTGTSTALGLSSSSVTGVGDANYAASFGANWVGEVVGEQITQSVAAGVISDSSSVKWHASYWLPPNTATTNPGVTPLTSDTRVIATSSSAAAKKGVAFRFSSISSTEQSTLGPTSSPNTYLQAVLNYIRGDATNEAGNGGQYSFRPRSSVLGDITNSKLQLVSAPSFPYADAPLNPGYSNFKTTYASRNPVVYVGANDGMMHAFDASLTSGTGGKELFAYVPSFLFNTNTDSQGNLVGLSSLVVNPLQHHFLVDAQPRIVDVDLARVGSAGAALPSSAASDWHTILFSGLGKGGMGFFALDVSNPSANSTEAGLASNVLWETTPANYPHMGYSYGTPLVTKTKRWGWTVVLTSGYDNDDGKGYIYLVNPKDGSLYETISTGAGSVTGSPGPAGLTYISGFTNNVADFTADALYAGDLLGNVWRVDLTQATSTSLALFATLTDPVNGNPQPVTTEPVIQADPVSLTRYVFVGTGRLLADSDLVNPQTQTFYALNDGTNATFSTITAPLTRANLIANTSNTLTGVTFGTKNGYYIDLASYPAGAGTQASAERVNIQPVGAAGAITFAANLYGTNICSSGSSRIFALSYETSANVVGTSLLSSNGNPYVTVPPTSGAVTGLSLVAGPTGLQILAGTSTGAITGASLKTSTVSFQKINWREVPTAQ